MAPPPTRSPTLDLVVSEGPDEGLRFPLDPAAPVPIGRAAKGVTLGDPLVSIHHAEITWTDGVPTIRDVGSATGTRVNGLDLRRNESRSLTLGDVILVGETKLVVRRRRGATFLLAVGLGIVLVSVSVAAGLALLPSPGATKRGDLVWDAPIRQGALVAPDLRPSPAYLRQRGLDLRRFRIARVTDHDADGIDEVWLRDGAEQLVITFDEAGEWRELGRMPAGCVDADRGAGALMGGFPNQNCPGVFLQMFDGRYQVAQHEAPVVWIRPRAKAPTPSPAAAGGEPDAAAPPSVEELPPIVPYRLGLRRADALSGFLGTRGVQEAVTWILCEDAHTGLAAQVRTGRGHAQPLALGCLADVVVEGRIEGDVVAVAFTAGGRANLLDEIARFYAGNADGMFLDRETRALHEAWSADPGFLQGGSWVEFKGHDQYFQPTAPEGELPPIRDGLVATALFEASPPAVTATLLSSGKARLDPPGCADFEITTGSWRCDLSAGCLPGSTFLAVREVGCGAPSQVIAASYRGGVTDADVGDLQVRVAVDVVPGDGAPEVLRARVAYRRHPER